jgi:Uri superfamily endonuclease
MESKPGTYALILRSRKRSRIQVGRKREVIVEPGYYVYIGSAFGPGGVRARVTRHCRSTKPKHWHIDYLREIMAVLGAWVSYEPDRLEHIWAQTLNSKEGITLVPDIGCTDCDCPSHLYFSSVALSFALYSRLMRGKIEKWKS